jgi:AIPR protein
MNLDENGSHYLANHPEIRLYGKPEISQEYIDLDAGIISDAAFTLTIDSAPFEFAIPNLAKLYLFAARASKLINLPGISDATLFSQNVRLSLGNTDVNKQIKSSIRARGEHLKFSLFHNGITLLCNSATLDKSKLIVRDFVVVNGAQSLSALFVEQETITSDLRLLLRVIEIKGNDELSRDITLKSNTQNAIKPRDMRSNHHLMVRLKKGFEELGYKNVVFEIKRGEVSDDHEIISNEEAGRLLLVFDLKQPYSCDQIYKVFDDFYADIFGRPQVNASRIILLNEIMKAIKGELDSLDSRPFAHYTLTRFFILYVVAEIIRSDQVGAKFASDPRELIADDTKMARFMKIITDIIKGVIIDLNHETIEFGENFDYKSMLKNREQILKLGTALISSYKKDVARNKADTISKAWEK